MAAVDGGMSDPGVVFPVQPPVVLKPELKVACPPIPPDNVNVTSFNGLITEDCSTMKVENSTEAKPTITQSTVASTNAGSPPGLTEALTCSSKSHGGQKYFTRIIEDPRAEAYLEQKMQKVTDLVVGAKELAKHELLRKFRIQQIHASYKKPSPSIVKLVNKSRSQRITKCAGKKPTKEAGHLSTEKGLLTNYTKNHSNFQNVNHHPNTEKQTQTFIEQNSLNVLADQDILTNQPKVVLTRCDIPESLLESELEPQPKSESEPELENRETELPPEQELESKLSVVDTNDKRQRKHKPTVAQIRARALNVSWKSSENKRDPVQKLEKLEKYDLIPRVRKRNPAFTKVIEDPKLEAQAEQVLRNFTDFVTVRSFEVPKRRLPVSARQRAKRRSRRTPSSDEEWSPSPRTSATSSSEEDWTSSKSDSDTSSNSSFYSDDEEEEVPSKARRKGLNPRMRDASTQRKRPIFENRCRSGVSTKQQRYRKFVDNPVAEEQAEQVESNFINLQYGPDKWAQQKQLNCPLDQQLLNSQISEWQINSHISQQKLNPQVDSCSQTPLTVPLIVKPEPSENPFSPAAPASFSNSCLQLPICLENGDSNELIRVKSEPLDAPLSTPPDTAFSHLLSVNYPNDGRTEETVMVKMEPPDAEEAPLFMTEQSPRLETAPVCENSERNQSQVSSTAVSEFCNSDLQSSSVCDSSDPIRNQMSLTINSELHISDFKTATKSKSVCHRIRDSDIMSFCNSIIEKSASISEEQDSDIETETSESKTVYHGSRDSDIVSFCNNIIQDSETTCTSVAQVPSVDTSTDSSAAAAHDDLKSELLRRVTRDKDIIVCSESKIVCRRRRDNDIKFYHKKVIENESAEAHFDALVYRISARYVSEDDAACLRGHFGRETT